MHDMHMRSSINLESENRKESNYFGDCRQIYHRGYYQFFTLHMEG
jgi:hypothetical protein